MNHKSCDFTIRYQVCISGDCGPTQTHRRDPIRSLINYERIGALACLHLALKKAPLHSSGKSGSGKEGRILIPLSRLFSTRIPRPELPSLLFRISISSPNFGESHFHGSSLIPYLGNVARIPHCILVNSRIPPPLGNTLPHPGLFSPFELSLPAFGILQERFYFPDKQHYGAVCTCYVPRC